MDSTQVAAGFRAMLARMGFEARPGQLTMLDAVWGAATGQGHVVVEGPVGIGKSAVYLYVGALLARRAKRTLVVTGNNSLLRQLEAKDLPAVSAHGGLDVRGVVLKGRANYLCLSQWADYTRANPAPSRQGDLFADPDTGEIADGEDELYGRVVDWARTTGTGDLLELGVELPEHLAKAASVTSSQCSGRRCRNYGACWAEAAKERAKRADLVVTNMHLFCTLGENLVNVLGDFDLIVVDECHQLIDIACEAAGVQLPPWRLAGAAREAKALIRADLDTGAADALGQAANRYRAGLVALGERRPEGARVILEDPLRHDALVAPLRAAQVALGQLRAAVAKQRERGQGEGADRLDRFEKSAATLYDDLPALFRPTSPGWVCWAETATPEMRTADVAIDDYLRPLWAGRAVVACSGTVPPRYAQTVGLRPSPTVAVPSPFDHESRTVFYVPAHLPSPRARGGDHHARRAAEAAWFAEVLELQAQMVEAAGGRALLLYTARARMRQAARFLAKATGRPLYCQGREGDEDDEGLIRWGPIGPLAKEKAAHLDVPLLATRGAFQGLDIAGLRLVGLDKCPWPTPDDPVIVARRRLADARRPGSAFDEVDIPHAWTLLAQAAGRLMRSEDGWGVVAVFDPDLASGSRNTAAVLAGLPPMRRRVDTGAVEAFLAAGPDGALAGAVA